MGFVDVDLQALLKFEISVTGVTLVTLWNVFWWRSATRLGGGVVVPSQVIQQFDSGSVRLEALPANEAVLVSGFEMLLHLVLPQVPPRHQHGITFWKRRIKLVWKNF